MLLTQEDRLRGAKNSLKQRRLQQSRRREEVKALHAGGMAKSKIAKKLGVTLRTIIRDLKS